MLKSASPHFFSQLDVSQKVYEKISLSDLDKIRACILENRYYQNGLCLEKIGEVDGISISSIRLSLEKRCITLSIDNTMVIVRYLAHHDYPKREVLESFCRKKIIDYTNDFEKGFQRIELSKSIKKEAAIAASHLTVDYHQSKIIFDEQQSQVCYTPLPLRVQGCPGSGKSLIGLFMLKEQEYGDIAYYSHSRFLVQKQKSLFEQQSEIRDSEKTVHFFCSENIYPREKTYRHHEIITWIDYTKLQFAHLQLIDSNHIIQELQTLYVLQKLFSESFKARYQNHFVRQSFYQEEQIYSLTNLFENFIEHFCKDESKPFVEGFICCDPIPGQILAKLIIDENQDCTVAENFFFFTKTENAQIVFLRDTKQSQGWQGMDSLSLFESIWYAWLESERKKPVRMQNMTLSKSYRNSQAVTKLANRILRLKNMWLEGTVIKDEEPLFEEALESSGQVRFYESIDSAEYRAIKDYLPEKSAEWAVVTQERYKEEARALFGPHVLVFSNQEVPGLEFTCLVRYKATDREVLSLQNGRALKEWISGSQNHLFCNKSALLDTSTRLIQSVGADITVTTRAKEVVLVIEPPVSAKDFDSPKKARIVQNALSYLYPRDEYCDHALPWAINMTASTMEEWTVFIRQLGDQGMLLEAERLFDLHIRPHIDIRFIEWFNPLRKPASSDLIEEVANTIESVQSYEESPKKVDQPITDSPRKEAKKSASERACQKKSNLFSSKAYKNIKSIIQAKELTTSLIKIESFEDLQDILFTNAIALEADPKNPIACIRTALPRDSFSFFTAFIQCDDKIRAFIRSKIEKLLGLSSIKKKIYSIKFFEGACSEDLLDFIAAQGVQKELITDVGAGLCWLILNHPQAYEFFEILIASKHKSSSIIHSDARSTVETLYNRWSKHIAPYITKDHKQSPGYESLRMFFYKHIGADLDWKVLELDDCGFESALYNFIKKKRQLTADSSPETSSKRIRDEYRATMHDIISLFSKEELLDCLMYRSKETNLTLFEMLREKNDLIHLQELLRELLLLKEQGLVVDLPGDILAPCWHLIKLHKKSESLSSATALRELTFTLLDLDMFSSAQVAKSPMIMECILSSDLSQARMEKYLNKLHPYIKDVCLEENAYRQEYVNIYYSSTSLTSLSPLNAYYTLFRSLVSNYLYEQASYFLTNGLNPIGSNNDALAAIEMAWNVDHFLKYKIPKELWIVFLQRMRLHNPMGMALLLKDIFVHLIIGSQVAAYNLSNIYVVDILDILFEQGLSITDFIECTDSRIRALKNTNIFIFKTLIEQNTILSSQDSKVSIPIAYLLFGTEKQEVLHFTKVLLAETLKQSTKEQDDFMLQYFYIAKHPQWEFRDIDTLFGLAIQENRPGLAWILLDFNSDIISHKALSLPPIYQIAYNIISKKENIAVWSRLLLKMLDRFSMMESLSNADQIIKYDFSIGCNSLFALLLPNHLDIAISLVGSKIFDLESLITKSVFWSQISRSIENTLKVKVKEFFDFLEEYDIFLKRKNLMNYSDHNQWYFRMATNYLIVLLGHGELKLAYSLLHLVPSVIFGYGIDMKNLQWLVSEDGFFGETPLVNFLASYEKVFNRETANETDLDKKEKERIKVNKIAFLMCKILESLSLPGSVSSTMVLLKKKYANCEIVTTSGKKSTIFLAMRVGFYDVVESLIMLGADLKVPAEYGSLFLMAIAQHAPENILKLIMEKQAECMGMSVEDYVNQYGSVAISKESVKAIAAKEEPIVVSVIASFHQNIFSYLAAAIICKNTMAMDYLLVCGYRSQSWSNDILLCIEGQYSPCLETLESILETLEGREGYAAIVNEYAPFYEGLPLEVSLSFYMKNRNPFMRAMIFNLLESGAQVTDAARAKIREIADVSFETCVEESIQRSEKKKANRLLPAKRALVFSQGAAESLERLTNQNDCDDPKKRCTNQKI